MIGWSCQNRGSRAGKEVLVGLGPGVGVEVGMGVMVGKVGKVGLGEGGVVSEVAGIGDSISTVMESDAWQPTRTIRMMVNIANPIRRQLRKVFCEDCIMMNYSMIV
jgi:hypothetical protein